MKFKVDRLPTADELCPFEKICENNGTLDCPKSWGCDLSNTDEYRKESIESRAELRECEFLTEY